MRRAVGRGERMSGQKTEKPTPQKLKKARGDGQLGRTPELGAWAGMLVASFVLPMVVRAMLDGAQVLLLEVSAVAQDPDPARALALLGKAARVTGLAVLPLGGGLLLVALLAGALQGGVRVTFKPLKPKFNRLNPFTGIKRMFGPKAGWEAVKALIKTTVVAVVLYAVVRQLLPVLMGSGTLPLNATVAAAGNTVLTLVRWGALAGLVMALADYTVVRRRNTKQLRMSKQEVKDEHKRSEGDPQLKGAIRSRQLAMSRNRMMSELTNADVVVVNPTHVAVALRYDPARGAPRLVAKGAGAIATKIREVAAERRIPMVQDVTLARTLYAGCELGQEVPAELYGAVARVLAFVMTLKARGSAAGLHRAPQVAAVAA
jgi:flagellar biosynthesis protein FlhB